MSATNEIGKTAGKVWTFLRQNGKASVSAVERGVDAPKRQVQMAIGWLAREGKLKFAEERNALQIWLAES